MSNDRTLSVERHISATPETVWRVMTERLEAWFCPRPWFATIEALEWRPGGRGAIRMEGPNGESILNEGVVLAVEPGRMFVMTDAFKAGWHPAGPFMVSLFEIEPAPGGTLYRATARHWTPEAAEQHRAMGFEAGWGMAADQLKALAEAQSVAG